HRLFLTHPPPPAISTLSLHDALPISILKAAELFKPDVFLVDYTPTGVWGELLPTLQMLKGQKDPPKVILGLRDILDAPEVTRERSEEHTSELQSRGHLVCRLLLEKKK